MRNVVDRVMATAGARLLRARRLMRAPIWLYRLRLGFVFGSRLLMLEHVGRTTAAKRYVVLEVIGRPSPDTYIVASAFGQEAQWYRNIQSNGLARVYTRSRTAAPATARTLTATEAESTLRAYIELHPRAWDALKPIIETTSQRTIHTHRPELPMVELALTAQR